MCGFREQVGGLVGAWLGLGQTCTDLLVDARLRERAGFVHVVRERRVRPTAAIRQLCLDAWWFGWGVGHLVLG